MAKYAWIFLDGRVGYLFDSSSAATEVYAPQRYAGSVPQFTLQEITSSSDQANVKIGWFHSAVGFSSDHKGPRVVPPGKAK